MNINQKFSKHLRRLRDERSLTQVDLAAAAGIDYKYLQKLEGKDPSSPTLETLAKLAKALAVTVSELTDGL